MSVRRTIALLTPDIGAHDLWLGVSDAAEEQGINLISVAGRRLRDSRQFYSQANVLYDLLSPERVNGLIAWTSSIGNNVSLDVTQNFCEKFHPIPIVSIGTQLLDIPSIVIDGYQGTFDAVSHLIKIHERRRIGFIRGIAGHHGAEERYRGYLDALKFHDIPFDPNLVSIPQDWEIQTGVNACLRWLKQKKLRLDAIVGASDNFALGAMQILQSKGISVPDEVSVVGFNDSPLSRTSTPPLTSVPVRLYDLGQRALELILAILDGEEVPLRTTVETNLIIRQSCGCLHHLLKEAVVHPVDVIEKGSPENSIHRDAAIQAGIAALQDSWIEPGWAARFMETFIADLDEERENPGFISLLYSALRSIVQKGGRASVWQHTVSQLRAALLPFYVVDPAHLIRLENLLSQARLIVGETARRSQAFRVIQEQERSDKLHEIEREMTTATSQDALLDVLARELSELGLPGCYLATYVDPKRPDQEADLLMAYNCDGRIDLPLERVRFPSSQLVPRVLPPCKDPFNWVVESLHYHDENMGFVVFEAGTRTGSEYDRVAEQISSALKGTQLLVQNIQLYQEALEAQEEAREADRLKTRFLSMVSHELRTPLSLLVGLSEILVKDEADQKLNLPAPYLQDLERIHISARHLDSLIRDVIDLSRSEVGQLRLAKEALPLDDVLAEVIIIGEKMVRDKGLSWQVVRPNNLPWIWADPMRIRQVVLNLLNNAVKFTPEGGILIKIEVIEGEVTVKICDSGIGVPANEQETIFSEYQQSEKVRGHGYGGLGIGLALSRQLVELHEGKIGVQSPGEEMGGSTFYFSLPTLLGQVDYVASQEIESQPFVIVSQKTEQAAAIKELLIASTQQPTKVLIVDDEPAIRAMHHRVVRRELPVARILEASNGIAALEMIATEQPDLVLLDLMMPEMDGFEVLEKLREVESARDTAVIVLTGKPLLDEDIIRLNWGVVKVLQKEVFTGEEIQSHVQSAIASGADVSVETKRVTRKAMAYIHHHFAEPLSREELASLVGVSERHLNRCFRQELGVTPMTYLTRYRIRQAKRMLEQGQYSISQIALATGFSESSYFARVFRREVGLTAGAYKRGERLTQ